MMIKRKWRLILCITVSFLLNACVTQKGPAPVYHLNLMARYEQIDRESYKGSTYKVKQGETLSFISYITGCGIDDIVEYNHLGNPNTIYPGQILRLIPPSRVSKKWRVTPVATMPVEKKKKPAPLVKNKRSPVEVVKKNSYKKQKPTVKKKVKKVVPKKTVAKITPLPQKKTSYAKVSAWRWPTQGKIIQRYSSMKGNKGVNIAGKKGQPIYATATGKVVYAGNALRGYGNIIIIKHNSDYLSAYAHNDALLVKENQQVKAGQKIALMGKTSSPIVQLHFEIRYKGKSVDPLRYLP